MSASNIKVEILHNVVQIETESKDPIHIELIRKSKVSNFKEIACCMNRCTKCGKVFSVFVKSSPLKCPDCVEPVEGFWTYCFLDMHEGFQQ